MKMRKNKKWIIFAVIFALTVTAVTTGVVRNRAAANDIPVFGKYSDFGNPCCSSLVSGSVDGKQETVFAFWRGIDAPLKKDTEYALYTAYYEWNNLTNSYNTNPLPMQVSQKIVKIVSTTDAQWETPKIKRDMKLVKVLCDDGHEYYILSAYPLKLVDK